MRSQVPFAIRNLTHRKVRSAIALAAVSFSVLFMFMEVGFYGSIVSAGAALYRSLDADIFLISSAYLYVGQTSTIPRHRLYEAQQAPGVREVLPLYIDRGMWRNPSTRQRHVMLVLGIDPALPLQPFDQRRLLFNTGDILVDSLTRHREFGPDDVGVSTEVGNLAVNVAGHYRIGPGFAANGAAAVSADTFIHIFPGRRIEDISMGLVRLDDGAVPDEVVAALQRDLPSDTRVVTQRQLVQLEQDYWQKETSLGPVFGSGVLLGFVIGMIVLYQVIFSDIAKRTREYATLKAMGYTFRQLVWIVLKEVSAFAIVGFVLGWAPSFLLYKVVRDFTGLPVNMSVTAAVVVFFLTAFMCWTSGFLAARKIGEADPAELF